MPKKWIVLLDVDETCTMSNSLYGQHDGKYRYHEALFQALKQVNLVQVYLFTSYNLRAIAKNLVEEPIATPSRLKLIQYLSKLGFQVEGVITPFDLIFNQGIGTYYEQRIKPYERQVLEGIDLQSKSAIESYVLACEQEETLLKDAHGISLDKGNLYGYLVQQLEKMLLQNNFAFIVVDDRSFHLEVVQKQNALHRYPLCSLLAKPRATVEEYLVPLQKFIHPLTIEAIKMRFEQRISLSQEMQKEYETLHKRFYSHLSASTDTLDTTLLEEIECFCVNRDALQDRNRLTISSHPKPLAWPEPDAAVERLHKEIEAIIGGFTASSSETQVEFYGLTPKPISIPLRLARQLLSQDEQGNVAKKNSTGNNVVTRLGQVFFKSSKGAELYPVVEQAVYQMNRQLGGELVAPTQLLLLKMPEEMIPLQASLAIEGVSLEEIISIPGILNGFKRILGMDVFLTLFPSLLELMDLSGKSYFEWLSRRGYTFDMPWEEQLKVVLDTLYILPVDARPVGLMSSQLSREVPQTESEKRKIVEDIIRKDFQREPLLPVLALIDTCPKLTEEAHLGDLFMIPNCFRLLRRLYPRMSSEPCLQAALNIVSNFDLDNLHRHFLLALLTEPGDHKGDNFIVPLKFDADGTLLPFKIIAIDNDMALDGCFRGKKEHSLKVKTVIYRLISEISRPFSTALINTLCAGSAEVLLLEWLGKLFHYSKSYSELKKERILSAGLYEALHLETPFSLSTVERLKHRLHIIQTLLSTSPALTAEALLLKVEPLVGRYYQRFGDRHPELQAFVIQLFKHAPSLEVLLSDPLDAKTIAEHFSSMSSPQTPPSLIQEDVYQAGIAALIRSVPAAKRNARFLYLCSVLTRLGYIRRAVTSLTLTEHTVAEAYVQEPEGFIRFLKACGTVILQFREYLLPLNDPQILFHSIASLSESKIVLLKFLLAYGLPVNIARPLDGFTPLHFAASFYPEGVLPLLQMGAHTEALDIQGFTPLDLAVLYHQTETVGTLLKCGAGERLKVPNGFKLISRYQRLYPDFCQGLISRHRELAWQLALEHVSQATETAERVCLIGPHSTRYLKSEVHQQIFKGGSTFPRTNLYGRHNVTDISCTFGVVSMGMHLKENPELPGREIMVQTLASQLFGFITPQVALWRFSKTTGFLIKTEVGYPVLASHTITGKPLTEVLENHPEWLTKLDPQSVCEAIVLAMLINPEDGRGDNYIVQPFLKGTETAYRLVSIDNDHAFVRPVLLRPDGQEVAGPRGLTVKTILYCLDAMKAPMVEELRRRLLEIDAQSVLSAWLRSLEKKQEEINGLFKEPEKRALGSKNIHLDIVFQPSIVVDIYQKLLRIQTVLRRTPGISLLRLLRYVVPSLGIRYEAAFQSFHSASDRFMFLTKDQFASVIVAGKPRLASKTPARDIISYTPQFKVEELKITEEQEASPHQALDCLKRVSEELTYLRKVRDEVQTGEFRQFRALMNSDNQERVVNSQGEELPGLDFAAMKLPNGNPNIALQTRILEELKRISFRRLKIHNCEALTDAGLNTLLMMSSGLLVLDIENCAQLTEQAMKHVAIRCTSLEKLGVRRLPRLQTVIELPFPKLRVLTVGGCPNLSEWRISAPQLARIEINQCEQLVRLSTHSLILRHLKLRDCLRLSNEQFNKIMRLPEHLQHIQLAGCPLIVQADFYQKYPQLAQLPIHTLSKEMVADLNQQLEQALSELDLEFPLPVNMIEALQQGVPRLIESQQQLIAALLKGLNDSSFSVRAEALKALGKLAAGLNSIAQAEVVSALLKGLNEPFSRLSAQAVGALDNLCPNLNPTTQAEIVSVLLQGLNSSYLDVRVQMAEVLGKLWAHLNPSSQAKVVSALLKGLNGSFSGVSTQAVEALSKLWAHLNPSTQAEVVSALLKGLNEPFSGVSPQAVEALSKLWTHLNPGTQAEVVSALLKGLNHSNFSVRARAAEALDNLWPSLSPATRAEVVSGLLKDLDDSSSSVKARVVEDLGSLAAHLNLSSMIQAEVVSTLLRGLNYSDSGVRAWAARDLSRLSVGLSYSGTRRCRAVMALGESTALLNFRLRIRTVGVRALLEGLEDSDFNVRTQVAEALSKPGTGLNPITQVEVVSALLKCLNDYDLDVRAQAAEALGSLAAHLNLSTMIQAEVVSALLKCLNDRNFYVEVQTVEALGKLCTYLNPTTQAEVVSAFLESLNGGDSYVKYGSIKYCIYPYVKYSIYPDVKCRMVAVLGSLAAHLNPTTQIGIMSVLLKSLNDIFSDTRCSAVAALGGLGAHLNPTAQAEVVSALLKSLNDRNPGVRVQAMEVLNKLGAHLSLTTQAEMVSALLEDLNSSDLYTKCRASEALDKLEAYFNPTAQADVVSALLKCLNDNDSSVRFNVVKALSKLWAHLNSTAQAEVVGGLLQRLNDNDSNVREKATEVLGKLGAHLSPGTQAEVVSRLLKCLSDNDAPVRIAAGRSIVHLLSPKIMISNLMYAFKAVYQKEFSSQNSKSRAKGFRESVVHQEGKERQEVISRIGGVPENMRELDVPADGTCLFYSVMFAFLLPAINDNVEFRARYLKLFGDEVSDSVEENRKRLQEYDGDPEFISRHTAAFEVLVNTTFRQRVVKYMRDNSKDFKVFIETEKESFETYTRNMEDPRLRDWGGQHEIIAISRLLEVNVQICTNRGGSAVPIRGGHYDPRYLSDCQINLVYTSVHKGSGSNNHYHYLIEKEYLKKRSVSNLSSSSSTQYTLPLFSHARSVTKTTSLGSLSSGGDVDEGKGIAETKIMAEEQTGVVKQSGSIKEVRLGQAERQAYELALAESLNDHITEESRIMIRKKILRTI